MDNTNERIAMAPLPTSADGMCMPWERLAFGSRAWGWGRGGGGRAPGGFGGCGRRFGVLDL